MSRPASIQSVDLAVYGLPYFDRHGLIVAEQAGEIVGYVHAGFGVDTERNSIDHSRGVICAIVVDPEHRRLGIGEELLKRAEAYLLAQGATSIHGGQRPGCDPFYFGIYGGARCSGFLQSDPLADLFFTAANYAPVAASAVLQLDLRTAKFPMNRTILQHKRKTDLVYSDKPPEQTMWWFTHFGNTESMFFELVAKDSGERIASVTVITLDNYNLAWKQRAIGLVNLKVEDTYRGQHYSLSLVIEALSRVRNDMVTLAEVHVPEDNPVAMNLFLNAGFVQIDRGVIYQKSM